jgi:hypothetical protein
MMIRALKVVLIIVGVIEILLGLLLIFMPAQAASGVSDISGYLKYMMAALGACLGVFGAFLIIAARDPLRRILWVKYAIVLCILGALGGLYSVMMGAVTFGQVGMQIIMDAVIAALLLALYPYRAAKGS